MDEYVYQLCQCEQMSECPHDELNIIAMIGTGDQPCWLACRTLILAVANTKEHKQVS